MMKTQQREVPQVRPLSWKAIEVIARFQVANLSPPTLSGEAPFPIHEICEFKLEEICGVSFVVENLPANEEGRFEAHPDGTEMIVNDKVYERVLAGEPRARFTLAHEFGHCVLHKRQLQILNSRQSAGVMLHRRGTIPPYRDPEWQANAFAASILMPIPAVQAILRRMEPVCRPMFGAAEVSRRLMVSAQAAEYRIQQLCQKGLV